MYSCPKGIYAKSILVALTGVAAATPSGLNNIPTADTTPQRTLVLQAFGTVGGEADDDFNLGFKTGVDLGPLDMEFGADSHISPGDAGPVTVQAKLALPLGDNLPTIAIGSANTTFSGADANRAGETFGYLVVSQDLCFLRGHAGCGLQDGALLPFVGFDKTFTKESFGIQGEERDLFTLRTDMIQQQDSSWLYSAGVLVPVIDHVVFETWANLPDNGDDASLTLKLNLVFNF
jgi:hypothetical protein